MATKRIRKNKRKTLRRKTLRGGEYVSTRHKYWDNIDQKRAKDKQIKQAVINAYSGTTAPPLKPMEIIDAIVELYNDEKTDINQKRIVTLRALLTHLKQQIQSDIEGFQGMQAYKNELAKKNSGYTLYQGNIKKLQEELIAIRNKERELPSLYKRMSRLVTPTKVYPTEDSALNNAEMTTENDPSPKNTTTIGT